MAQTIWQESPEIVQECLKGCPARLCDEFLPTQRNKRQESHQDQS